MRHLIRLQEVTAGCGKATFKNAARAGAASPDRRLTYQHSWNIALY
jgi:hypothetical protein